MERDLAGHRAFKTFQGAANWAAKLTDDFARAGLDVVYVADQLPNGWWIAKKVVA